MLPFWLPTFFGTGVPRHSVMSIHGDSGDGGRYEVQKSTNELYCIQHSGRLQIICSKTRESTKDTYVHLSCQSASLLASILAVKVLTVGCSEEQLTTGVLCIMARGSYSI